MSSGKVFLVTMYASPRWRGLYPASRNVQVIVGFTITMYAWAALHSITRRFLIYCSWAALQRAGFVNPHEIGVLKHQARNEVEGDSNTKSVKVQTPSFIRKVKLKNRKEN